jgi:hypothetical protein
MSLDSPIKLQFPRIKHAMAEEFPSHALSVFPSYFGEFTGIFSSRAFRLRASRAVLRLSYSRLFFSASRPVSVV